MREANPSLMPRSYFWAFFAKSAIRILKIARTENVMEIPLREKINRNLFKRAMLYRLARGGVLSDLASLRAVAMFFHQSALPEDWSYLSAASPFQSYRRNSPYILENQVHIVRLG